MYDSRTVANVILELAEKAGDTLTPMQLLKLVYLAHGWTLGLLGRPLIKDRVEAWQYGPVIPALYAAVREFKSDPVVGPLSCSAKEILDNRELEVIKQGGFKIELQQPIICDDNSGFSAGRQG